MNRVHALSHGSMCVMVIRRIGRTDHLPRTHRHGDAVPVSLFRPYSWAGVTAGKAFGETSRSPQPRDKSISVLPSHPGDRQDTGRSREIVQGLSKIKRRFRRSDPLKKSPRVRACRSQQLDDCRTQRKRARVTRVQACRAMPEETRTRVETYIHMGRRRRLVMWFVLSLIIKPFALRT